MSLRVSKQREVQERNVEWTPASASENRRGAGQRFSVVWARRIAIVVIAFAIAFILDAGTDRRMSSVWGSGAIVASALALFPMLRRYALPVAIWAGIWVAFNLARAVTDSMPWASSILHLVGAAETRLLGGSPGFALQHALVSSERPGVLDFMLTAVHISFFVAPHALAAALLMRSRRLFWRYTVATSVVLAASAIGTAILPTAPPWMDEAGSGGPVVRIANVVLNRVGLAGTRADGTGFSFEPNAVAAMPSVHLAATALITLVAWRSPSWRYPALAYCIAMGFSLVYLGEHHLLDIVAGGVLAVVGWRMAGRLVRRAAGLERIEAATVPPVTPTIRSRRAQVAAD